MKTKTAAAVLAACAAAATTADAQQTLPWWDRQITVADFLYPAGVQDPKAQATGIELDPPSFVSEDPERVRVLWKMRYRMDDAQALDRIRKAWEASLPEEVDLVIGVHAMHTGKGVRTRDAWQRRHREDEWTLETLTALGVGRAHETLVEYFADPARGKRAPSQWRPTKKQWAEWTETRRASFAEGLGIAGDAYVEAEKDEHHAWKVLSARTVNGELNRLLWNDPRVGNVGYPWPTWLPRIVVQGRWLTQPNIAGGIVENLRAANAAIARELAATPREDGLPRSTAQMRDRLAPLHGLVLNRGWRTDVVWNEEAAELWSLSRDRDMEVVRVRKAVEGGRGWALDDGSRRITIWPVAQLLEAYPDGLRHPAMVLAERLRAEGGRLKVRGGAITLGPGSRTADDSGAEGSWRVEGGGISYRIGERAGRLDWKEAARKAGMKDIARGDASRFRWQRDTPWHPWVEATGGA